MCPTVRAAVHWVGAAIAAQRGSSSSIAANRFKTAAVAVTSPGRSGADTPPVSRTTPQLARTNHHKPIVVRGLLTRMCVSGEGHDDLGHRCALVPLSHVSRLSE